jgi:hypothetical protein
MKEQSQSLYLVSEGVVSPATADTPWDGESSVLVVAASEADALEVASAYGRGLVQADNIVWDGRVIGAVRRELRVTTSRSKDGLWVWSGDGYLRNGRIDDCPADLGEDVYEALEAVIDGTGTFGATVEGVRYRAVVEVGEA